MIIANTFDDKVTSTRDLNFFVRANEDLGGLNPRFLPMSSVKNNPTEYECSDCLLKIDCVVC